MIDLSITDVINQYTILSIPFTILILGSIFTHARGFINNE